jgi:hypothetical protein
VPQHLARNGLVTIGACALVALGVLACIVATPAYAYNENFHVPGGGCGGDCHTTITINEANCASCHTFAPDNTNFSGTGGDAGTNPDFPLLGEFAQRGPHGVYKTTTSRCPMCHTLHDAPNGSDLLPGATIKATCFTCHDGTAGFGVYGTIAARGVAVGGGHSVEVTSVVPGGDAASGGSATVAFRGPGGTMTCSDCHSPHDSNTVQAFTGERIRIRALEKPIYSTKLLKKLPTGASVSTDYYGSDWCAGCHQGRASGGAVHNHPVETKASRPADFYYYNRLAVYAVPPGLWGSYEGGNAVPVTNTNAAIGAIGNLRTRGPAGEGSAHPIPQSSVWMEADYHSSPWLMTYPRSPLHSGHAPICQQCHEDKRNCGTLSSDGTTASVVQDGVWTTEIDGFENNAWVTNPRFQNFPHETENTSMLVETGDDLCLNCHPTGVLP